MSPVEAARGETLNTPFGDEGDEPTDKARGLIRGRRRGPDGGGRGPSHTGCWSDLVWFRSGITCPNSITNNVHSIRKNFDNKLIIQTFLSFNGPAPDSH